MPRSPAKIVCAKRSNTPRPQAPINPQDVTAVVLTRNEERNLARMLGSLPPEMPVIVIDHESQDATREIARNHGASVFVRRFEGFVNARLFGLAHVHTPWTLMIDADEVLDEQLCDAILTAPEDVDGYEVVRSTFYCGRAMRMWSGERLLRLFRTERVRLQAAPAAGGDAQLHERWVCEGPTGVLAGVLLHYSYPTHDEYREKFERYTAIEAAGVRATPMKLLAERLRTPLRFVWYALACRAALDGRPGLRVAWWSARYPAVVQWKALHRG